VTKGGPIARHPEFNESNFSELEGQKGGIDALMWTMIR
jgi:hypothetical protein